ncbi:MAG: hypothetical protein ACTJHU_10065 [Mycetocola sp.]
MPQLPSSRIRPVQVAGLAIAVTVVSGLLVGCTVASQAEVPAGSEQLSSPAVHGQVTATPGATAKPAVPQPIEVAQGVIGAGTLTTPEGVSLGQVEIHNNNGVFTLEVDGFSSPDFDVVSFSLAPRVSDPSDRCPDQNYSLNLTGEIPAEESGSYDATVGLLGGEPRNWGSVVVNASINDVPDYDTYTCGYPIVAVAPVTWTSEPTRPWLMTLADGGPASGATGAVELDGAGAPLSYTVAANDSVGAVTKRLGVSAEDLRFLNSTSEVNLFDTDLYVGDVLNLRYAGWAVQNRG